MPRRIIRPRAGMPEGHPDREGDFEFMTAARTERALAVLWRSSARA